jgi:nucleoside-diphosphate-sugar epimerase
MSSTTTVGIIGHTGRVGSQVLKNLITYHEQGQIEVIVLHRPSSDISKVPSGIETRVIDLTQDEPEKHLAAIQGINVIMSVNRYSKYKY